MVRSIRIFPLLAAVGACVALSTAAQADITRHCTASLNVNLRKVVDKDGNAFVPKGKTTAAAVSFKGQGRCKNKRKADQCREQARNLISICGGALWGARWQKKVPRECSVLAGSSRPYGGVDSWGSKNVPLLVRGKLTGDVKRSVEYTACCELQPHARQLEFLIQLKTQGDKGCPYSQNLEQRYQASCKKLRAQGLCR